MRFVNGYKGLSLKETAYWKKLFNERLVIGTEIEFESDNGSSYSTVRDELDRNGVSGLFKNCKKEKIDIYKQIEMNLDRITDYVLAYINKERDYE